MLQHEPLNDPHELQRAEDAISRLQDQHLSKYSAFDPRMPLPEPGFILLIKHTRADGAVRASGGGQIDFDAMLAHARAHFPDHKIIIRTHPETRFNLREGYFSARHCDSPQITLFNRATSPWHLLERAKAVYSFSSQLGFEAILSEHRPHIFGQPFYAGWRVTNDLGPKIARRKPGLTLQEFLYGCMIIYPRYFDPVTRRACPVKVVVDRLLDPGAHRPSQANRVLAKLQGWFAKPDPFWR